MNVEIFYYSTIPKFMHEHGKFCLWKLAIKINKTNPDKTSYYMMINNSMLQLHNTIHLLKKLWRHLTKVIRQILALNV